MVDSSFPEDNDLVECTRCGDKFEPEVEMHPDDYLCDDCVAELEAEDAEEDDGESDN